MQLLVSVTNMQESEEAVKGGAEILDIKNPAEGSLGAAHPSVIAGISNRYQKQIPVSVALGDFPDLPNTAALAAVGAASCRVNYIKIGLYGSRNTDRALKLVNAVQKTVNQSKIGIIAVAYADWEKVGTIDPLCLPAIAHNAGIAGCMIDTFTKKGKGLFGFMQVSKLKEFVSLCRKYNLISALAGSLQLEDLTTLAEIKPSIIGVRGAACTGNNRHAALKRERVLQLKKKISELSF